jgi:ATP-binding cassette, subfamily B, bacterial
LRKADFVVSREGGSRKNRPDDREGRLTIAGLLKPHEESLALTLAAIVGGGVTNLLQPWPLKIVFDVVSGTKPVHGWLRHLVHTGLGSKKVALLQFAAIGVVGIAVLDAAFSYLETYMTAHVAQWVTHDLRRKLYNHIQQLSLAYHQRVQTGDLISRLTTDIDAIQTFVVSGLVGLAIDALTLVGMTSVMFYLDWGFTLIALSAAPPLFALTYSFTRRSKEASRAVRRKQSQMVSVMQEELSAFSLVKAFGREEYEQARLEEESMGTVEAALNARTLKAKLSPLVEIVVAVGTALVLWLGGRRILAGTLSAGSLIVFIWYLAKMYKPMQDFAKMTDAYSKAAVGYERIREVLETKPGVEDQQDAQAVPHIQGKVELENVNFSYAPGEPVLTDINFKIEAGQMTALVGPTGAGKSTIASLIARLYDPDSGAVRVDGRDIRQLSQRSLRDQISFVLQDNVLFHTTIAQNIAYGKLSATRQAILNAAELANADEFISRLPEGYDTVVGERGATLSGGQRQRIAIARAIIRNSPILILDEPSSGLDAVSEQLVFQAIERLIQGKTAIVIAHRFSTIRRASVILVLDKGHIVESGHHEQLLKSGGLYARLYDLQFRKEDVNANPPLVRIGAQFTDCFEQVGGVKC